MKSSLLTILTLFFGLTSALLADEWKHASPDYKLSFPRDHGSHPEYQVEWWYFTGNLKDGEREFGFELTFFRFGISRNKSASNWTLTNLYAAHFAVTDKLGKNFEFFEKLSRPPFADAGADTGRLKIWNGDWRAEMIDSVINLSAHQGETELKLNLTPGKPISLHGSLGYSQKGQKPTNATHYYSFSRLRAEGELRFGGKSFNVEGQAWMDHEFGTSFLDKGQKGWDWLSLQMHDGRDLMLFQLRRDPLADGLAVVDSRSSGSLILKDGSILHLKDKDFRMTPLEFWRSAKSGCNYPIKWRVEIPQEKLDFEVSTTVKDQELRTSRSTGVNYWEGSVESAGLGVGYLELTGYCEH